MPDLCPYIYDVSISGFTRSSIYIYIYDISSLRVKELNTDTVARIKSNNQITTPITISNGVRHGDSLSPMLFNLTMDKIIENLPKELGYRMGNNPIHILC